MKRKHYYTLSAAILALLAIFYLVMCPKSKPAPSVNTGNGPGGGKTPASASITFGNSTMGCAGKGICNATSGIITQSPNDSATEVTFFSPTTENPNVIYMTFNINQLAQHQPGQVAFFRGQSSYIFELPFSISQFNPIFAQWANQVPPGAIISASSGSALGFVEPGDTIVIDTITFSVSQPVTVNVVFGDTVNGQLSTDSSGIFSISASSPPPPNSVPVTISLAAGNASQLVLSYNYNVLKTNENPQIGFYPVPGTTANTGTYRFAGNYNIAASLPAANQLFLPANAFIAAGSIGSFTIQPGGQITDTITYAPQPANNGTPAHH